MNRRKSINVSVANIVNTKFHQEKSKGNQAVKFEGEILTILNTFLTLIANKFAKNHITIIKSEHFHPKKSNLSFHPVN